VRVIEIPIEEAPHELAQTHKTMVLWIPSINGTLALLAHSCAEDVVITRNRWYKVLPSQDSLFSKSACERSVLLVPWPHLSNG